MLRGVDLPSTMDWGDVRSHAHGKDRQIRGDLGRGWREQRLALANLRLQWGFREGSRGGSVLVFAVGPRFCKRIQTWSSIDGSDVSDADGFTLMPLRHLLRRRSG